MSHSPAGVLPVVYVPSVRCANCSLEFWYEWSYCGECLQTFCWEGNTFINTTNVIIYAHGFALFYYVAIILIRGYMVIMSAMASPITSLTIVYSTVYSRADQRKYQSSAWLAFAWGIHRWPVNSPHKGPVTRIFFFIWCRHHEMPVKQSRRGYLIVHIKYKPVAIFSF